jgi:hypothetical protein
MPWKFAMPVVTCCRCVVAVTRVFSLLLPLTVAIAAEERDGADGRDGGVIPALVTVRIPTLEQLATDSREENQPVSKSVLNSDVTGRQTTVTETRLKIIPESQPLQFELQTSGQIRSETTGVNPQALVDSVGQHQFEMIKPMWFDGTIFRTQKSHGTIQALQTPTRVRSVAGTRMPLVAPLGDQLAWNKVMRLQPRINQLVAAEVSKDVVPEIDQVIDQRFRDLGNQWVSLQRTISNALPVFSRSWHAAASRQSVHLWNGARSDIADRRSTQNPGTARSGGFVELQAGEDLAVSLSEDVLTRAIAAVVPTGQTVPDVALPRLKSTIQQTGLADLPTMATQLRKILKEAPTLFALEFDERNPVTARCRDGQVDLTFHFRIHPNLGKASEWMSAAISLTAEGLTRETWTVRVSSVDVRERGSASRSGIATLLKPDESSPDFVIPGAPAPLPATTVDEGSTEKTETSSGPSSAATGSAWTTVVRNSLQTLLQAAEPPRLPLEFSGPEMNAQATRLRMVRLRAEDGRLRVVLRLNREPAAKVSAR